MQRQFHTSASAENHARIEQIGTPREILARPATPFVRQFLGNEEDARGVGPELHQFLMTRALAGSRAPS